MMMAGVSTITGDPHRVLGTQRLHLVIVEGVVVETVGQIDELVRVIERAVIYPLQQTDQHSRELQIETIYVFWERVRGLHRRFILLGVQEMS